MNEESTTAPVLTPDAIGDALDFYRSLTSDRRDVERDIIMLSLDNGVFPDAVRYGVFEVNHKDTKHSVFRGVIKSISGDRYYFQLPPNGIFHIVKADTETKKWEAEKLIKSCSLGCDLIKAKKNIEDATKDDEEEKKAGGAIADMAPPSTPEAHDVQTTESQMTENHPGGAMGTTPQQDGSAERWHGSSDDVQRALPQFDHSQNPNAWSTNDLLKAWGQQLQATAPRVANVDPQMRKYMIEIMGKTPQEIDSGRVQLSGVHRAQYNQWVTKSTRVKMNSLQGWLQKSRDK